MKRRDDGCYITDFTPAMTQELQHLYLECRTKAFTWLDTQTFSLRDFANDTKEERIRVAVKDSRVIGFSSLWLPERFIHHLYISPDYLGQGVGSMLMQELKVEHAKLRLKCMVNNTSAIEFYRHHQFELSSTHHDNEVPYHLMIWTNNLNE